MYCLYYQAKVNVTTTWFLMGVLKAEDGIAFERTLAGRNDTIEFFVTHDYRDQFIQLMSWMQGHGYVKTLEELPNRFATGNVS